MSRFATRSLIAILVVLAIGVVAFRTLPPLYAGIIVSAVCFAIAAAVAARPRLFRG